MPRGYALLKGGVLANVPDKGAGCWEWPHARFRGGYGKYRSARAHRVSYEEEKGPIPAGQWVLHRCDNPACVRPSHLFLGSAQENVDDMVRKGRQNRGEARPIARLNETIVREIRASKENNCALARRYQVNVSTVRHVRIGRTWGHVS